MNGAIIPANIKETVVVSTHTTVYREGSMITVTFDNTAVTSGTISDTIPSGYRPSKTEYNIVLACIGNTNKPAYVALGTTGTPNVYSINTDGSVSVVTGSIFGQVSYMI